MQTKLVFPESQEIRAHKAMDFIFHLANLLLNQNMIYRIGKDL